jgi:hypothetical protein
MLCWHIEFFYEIVRRSIQTSKYCKPIKKFQKNSGSMLDRPPKGAEHSKRAVHDVGQYRNLRLGNFMELPENEQVS